MLRFHLLRLSAAPSPRHNRCTGSNMHLPCRCTRFHNLRRHRDRLHCPLKVPAAQPAPTRRDAVATAPEPSLRGGGLVVGGTLLTLPREPLAGAPPFLQPCPLSASPRAPYGSAPASIGGITKQRRRRIVSRGNRRFCSCLGLRVHRRPAGKTMAVDACRRRCLPEGVMLLLQLTQRQLLLRTIVR